MEHKSVLPGTKMFLPATKKGSSKGSPMGTAKEPFKVLDRKKVLSVLKSRLSACLHQKVTSFWCIVGLIVLDIGYFTCLIVLLQFVLFFQWKTVIWLIPSHCFVFCIRSLSVVNPTVQKQKKLFIILPNYHAILVREMYTEEVVESNLTFFAPRLETSEQAAPVMMSLINAKGSNQERSLICVCLCCLTAGTACMSKLRLLHLPLPPDAVSKV